MKINICYLTDDALETFKSNIETIHFIINNSPSNNRELIDFLPVNPFVKRKYTIEDFQLKTAESGNYKEVDYQNSITLYESLKHLPRRILTDERFWLWLNIKYYEVSIQAMKIKSSTTLRDHWTFYQGTRRGVFFGVLSRSFFRVDLSVDPTLEDKYELTKYVIENPERFRTLSWRSYSSNKSIVLGALKAQKKFEEAYPGRIKREYYNLVSKRISRYGSVKLLDSLTEEEVFNIVYDTLIELTEIVEI